MSDEPTCCYCGETLLCCPWHIPDRELLERGYHYWCHQTRQEPGMLRAQIAALEAAHDAALAEADRYCDECDRLMDHVLAREARWQARAESAEAQLALAREDGARSMAAMLKEHWLAGIDCDHETKADRPRCACSRVNFGWYKSVGEAVNRWTEHLLAAWQAHETEATG